MKTLLIQPPQWYPVSPHLAVPLLSGQLKRAGFHVRAFDMSAEFYNRLLTLSAVKKACDDAAAMLPSLEKKYAHADVEQLSASASAAEKTLYLKYKTVSEFFASYSEQLEETIGGIDDAVRVLKTAPDFFDPEKLADAKHMVNLALRILSLPYAPNELAFDNYFANPLFNLDWENIKQQCRDSSVNMFSPFYDEILGELLSPGYDLICISMTDLSQLIPIFTLCEALKSRTDAKIAVGGNYATQIYEDIARHSDIFDDFLDYLLIGDGEYSIVRLAEYLDGRTSLDDVPNIVYRKNGAIISTGLNCERIDMQSVAYADFDDYDFSQYFAPETVFPMQLSKGCYWGKCSFCDYFYGQQGYCPKTVKNAIEEIRYYVKKYNASKFIFVDEAIPPEFYNRLADAIIESGLKINFYSFARLESGFTKEVLDRLYSAGARLFLWGYENYSERIMKLMNKGIDIEHRLEILTRAREAGIWNNGLFIFGYPTETEEEIEQTKQVIRENRRVIPSCTLSNFSLKKHSRLKDEVGSNGVVGYSENGEFYTVFKDVIDGVSQSGRREIRRGFQSEFLEENAHSLWSVVFSDFDHLLLYLCKHGIDYVCSYRSENRICPEFR